MKKILCAFCGLAALLSLAACGGDDAKHADNKRDFASQVKEKMPIPTRDDSVDLATQKALEPDSDFRVAMPRQLDSQKLLQKFPNRFSKDGIAVADAFNDRGEYLANPQQVQDMAQIKQKLWNNLAQNAPQNAKELEIKRTLQSQIQNGAILGTVLPQKSLLNEDISARLPDEGLKGLDYSQKKSPDSIYQPTDRLDRPFVPQSDQLPNNAQSAAASLILGKNIPNAQLNQNKKPAESKALPLLSGQAPIAVLLPLSGSRGELGRDFWDSASLALSQLAQQTGNQNLAQIVPIDTKGTEAGAQIAMQKATAIKANIIIGPLFANEVNAVQGNVGKDQLMIALSNSTAVARPNIYPIGFYPEQQIAKILEHLQKNQNERVAMMIPDNQYGKLLWEIASQYAKNFNIKLIQPLIYPEDSQDFSALISKYSNFNERQSKSIKGQKPIAPNYDAIIIGETNVEKARTIISQLENFSSGTSQIKVIALQTLDNIDKLYQEPASNGLWLVTSALEQRAKFSQLFLSSFKRLPDRRASLAFDAMALAIYLNSKSADPLRLVQTLTQGFDGVDGHMVFSQNGLVNRNYRVYELTKEGVKILAN